MAIIREPLDVDFFFDPTPPSKKELEMISQYIRDYEKKGPDPKDHFPDLKDHLNKKKTKKNASKRKSSTKSPQKKKQNNSK